MLLKASIYWYVSFISFVYLGLHNHLHSNAPLQKVNSNGNVLRSEVLGSVKMRCYLSGMPELRLGLNDKVMFEATGRGKCWRHCILKKDVSIHIFFFSLC